ncbi:3a8e6998-d433-431d-a756-17ba90af5aeb [Thermothielavioides terrestris]|uniref:Uncharacterized protein n=2 Tax=Thermothielavioides terrestris TaxID=2587410 RepID=G2REE6_THETT|nr:uncharacterized protein THITE_2121093 [Thermothielavioides terrestris NRRL 8126]AEO70118.1 hypothetical protein THITE_2121093 [Thermothielavioides terrestris NRRL 8126]SPQ17915.1 3a8e6998-d433-431d-a756-17ba90af5aeb [Thermothielavioides terrestris]
MEFIDLIRRIQADEESSDEEAGLVLTAASTAAGTANHRRRASPPDTDAVAGPSHLAGKAKFASGGGERNSVADGAPVAEVNGVVQADQTKNAQKRTLDSEKAGDETEQQRATKSVKLENGRTVNGDTSGVKKVQVPVSVAAESSKTVATVPAARKPVHQMEYFERRVYDMLSDPLGFDDCVYDANEQMRRHAARKLARHHRRRQNRPAPPLEMSGALGPVHNLTPAAAKAKPAQSLAKMAQKQAHQRKVAEQVQALKGKGGASTKAGGMGKGKALESIRSQQGSVKEQGGQQRPSPTKQYSQLK